MGFFSKQSKYPDAIDKSKVGNYDALAKSGGGYFYDDVLEYRVWIHIPGEEVRFASFATYKEALQSSKDVNSGKEIITTDQPAVVTAESPLVLVRQEEWIDEPKTGKFIHKKGLQPRVAEWKPEWLVGRKGTKANIPKFLSEHSAK
jgi:putative acetyltransferase